MPFSKLKPMQKEREPKELANRVRMLNNSLQVLMQQEDVTKGEGDTHPDPRIPRYEARIAELRSRLSE